MRPLPRQLPKFDLFLQADMTQTPSDTRPSDRASETAAAPVADAPEAAAEAAAVRPSRPGWACAAMVLAVVAWISLPFFYVVALAAGVAAVVAAIVALRQPRGAWRNLALTALVAAAVLLLVLAVFWSVLLYTLAQA